MRNGDETTRRAARRRTARILVAVELLIAIVIACGWIPGPIGTGVSVILPALGAVAVTVAIVTLLVLPRAAIAASVSVLVWLVAIAPALPAPGAPAGDDTLAIVSQNVRAQSGGGEASARDLAAAAPDVITLTELDDSSRNAANRVLAEAYPYSYAVGTVGVWSRLPLSGQQPLDLGLGWNRALHVSVQAPGGEVSVYLIHAASVRPGVQSQRDEMIDALAATVREDPATQVVALGDFNSAATDPSLRALGGQLDQVRSTAGLGFTWPAAFPMVRIDHVFQRGFTVASAVTVRAGASDHLATLTTLTPR